MRVFTLFLFLTLSLNLSAQSPDTLANTIYKEEQLLNVNYNGIGGHTLGIEFGKRKTCQICEDVHRKFWGIGLEGGIDKNNKGLLGAKIMYQRGNRFLGWRATLFPFTDFESFRLLLRPEFILYPFRSKAFSVGVGYNISRNFKTKKLFQDFDVFNLNARYYFAL